MIPNRHLNDNYAGEEDAFQLPLRRPRPLADPTAAAPGDPEDDDGAIRPDDGTARRAN